MIQQVTGQIKPFLELVRWSKSPKRQETAQAAGHAVIQIDSTSLITAIRTVFMDVLSISAFLPPPELAWQIRHRGVIPPAASRSGLGLESRGYSAPG
jgi:hypothetical protein